MIRQIDQPSMVRPSAKHMPVSPATTNTARHGKAIAAHSSATIPNRYTYTAERAIDGEEGAARFSFICN